ncbi:MAG: glycosyl transferase family protein [uncultured bacterium]|nr:MAG: glycosyl transferase family protein [uncultured bacterium]HBR71549.1 hypothetical protein [Candidatus Moranbacteria bacterium]
MKSLPEVTILITILNGSKTIDQCLESVCNQTYKNKRIVCINDASSDDTAEKLALWEKKIGSEIFQVITNKNHCGVTISLNKGLHIINSKYTARIDIDDWWDNTKLTKQVDFLTKNPDYKIIGSNYINYNGKIKKEIYTQKDNKTIRKNIIKQNPFAHSCVIYETKLIKKVGGYDESIKYGGDYDLYMRLFPFTKFHNMQDFLCFRMIENEGISIKRQHEQMIQGAKTQIKYIKKYKLSKINYVHIIKLLAIAFTPKFIRNLKRSLLG